MEDTKEQIESAKLRIDNEFNKLFYKTFYVPENATLSIAGDIDIEQAKTSIAKYFKEVFV